jgi:hypothetical protein
MKMKLQRIDIFLIICVIIFSIIMTVSTSITYDMYQKSVDAQNLELSQISNKYPVFNATFHSPNIIISTNSVSEFMQKAQDVNATQVYYTENEGYVVVDNDFRYAYNFQPTIIQPFFFILIYLPGICIFISVVIWRINRN